MVSYRHFLHHLILSNGLMGQASRFHSNSFYKSLGKEVIHFVVLHVKKLILQ